MVVSESMQQAKRYPHPQGQPSQIKMLIAELGNSNGLIRQQARISLNKMGEPAVDALIEALNIRRGPARWEAAKALSQIGSPKAAQALVKALSDDQFSIRWLAAEGLIKLGRNGLRPLLEALWQAPDSIRLQTGAHHILYDLVSQESLDAQLLIQLRMVLAALNYLDPAVALPATVMPALKMLE